MFLWHNSPDCNNAFQLNICHRKKIIKILLRVAKHFDFSINFYNQPLSQQTMLQKSHVMFVEQTWRLITSALYVCLLATTLARSRVAIHIHTFSGHPVTTRCYYGSVGKFSHHCLFQFQWHSGYLAHSMY